MMHFELVFISMQRVRFLTFIFFFLFTLEYSIIPTIFVKTRSLSSLVCLYLFAKTLFVGFFFFNLSICLSFYLYFTILITVLVNPPDAMSWLIGKAPDAGKDWRREEKGTTEDEIVGWHHQHNGNEFEKTPGFGDGHGGLACCSPSGLKELNLTERPSRKAVLNLGSVSPPALFFFRMVLILQLS